MQFLNFLSKFLLIQVYYCNKQSGDLSSRFKNKIISKVMQSSVLKEWGLQSLQAFRRMESLQFGDQEKEPSVFEQKKPIIKLPLQFTYPPVEIISKELTKLNSKYKQRVIYMGPRWNDSFQWHKKFSKSPLDQSKSQGYYFDQKRVQRNNSFIQDLMNNQNRFFKNQLYYSVFEGMNPTIREQIELVFQSRFESGNLDCVVKTNENQYDLFLRIDANTRGNIFWYFFKVSLPRKTGVEGRKVKFNICNNTKSKTLYERNFKPYVKRTKFNKNDSKIIDDWSQGSGISNCKIRQKKLRYPYIYQKVCPGPLYQLSFQLQLNPEQEVSLAYCIPYTYSYLMNQLSTLQSQIKEKVIPNVYIKKLGESLTGVEIPIIVIGDINESDYNNQKKVVFITGRAHPGQSNGSIIVSSLIKELCLRKNEEIFEKKAIFVIVPMLNPDGVILGNGRSSALGRDLNREFKSSNIFLNPQVVGVKKLIERIQENYDIQFYFDFHGHSKKKNIFFFGPSYSLTEPNYYRCRVFPKILAKNLDFFRYFGCSYSISQNKRATARAVMLFDYKIPFFYTVETSIGFYYDYTKREDAPFNRQTYFKIGLKFKESLKQYFEGLQQYEAFLKTKRKQKAPKVQNSSTLKILSEKKSQKEFEIRNTNHQQKVFSLRLVKMFDQIRIQTKNNEKAKNQQKSQTQSDSCRSSEELQTQKIKEFSQMLVAFNRLQEKKIKPYQQNSFSIDKTPKRKRKKRFSKNHSAVQDTMNSFIRKMAAQNQTDSQLNSKGSRFDLSKQLKSKQSHLLPKELSEQQKSFILNSQTKISTMSPNKKLQPFNISTHNFFKRNVLELQIQQNDNIGFVNFSKVIQNPRNLRYSQTGRHYRASTRNQKKQQKNGQHLAKFFFPLSSQKEQPAVEEAQIGVKPTNCLGTSKPYPASFYRIKYQSSHKKYRNKTPEPLQTSKNKDQKNFSFGLSDMKTMRNNSFRQPQKLFINVTKFTN